jgi:Na+/melibiose symporter-like transporter
MLLRTFVFMTMILFQLNFYTDVFGLSASAAAAVLLWPRLWDAVFDPIMGVLADRTNTRWGSSGLGSSGLLARGQS